MHAEIATYARELGWILDAICAALGGLTAAQLNWRPSTGEANSAYAIASHVVGSTRVYALGFGCGRQVERDRAAEFAAAGADPAELVATIRQLAREVDAALAALGPSELDMLIVPPPELWGTGRPHSISRRDALVESIRHGALHLGELRLTRDLAVRSPASPRGPSPPRSGRRRRGPPPARPRRAARRRR
jgi:DinB family protein